MKTIISIISYELRTRLMSWITLIFFLMLVFQGVWYTKGSFDYYVNDHVLMNAPAIFYKNFAGLGMLMIIIIAIVTGGVLYKDIQYKTAQWVYCFPVNEKQFFIGRFLAAFIYLLIVSSGFFIGMLLVPYSGIGEAYRFGPAPIGQMLHGVLLFLIPNVLLYVAAIFAAVVFFRQMAVSYLVLLLLVMLFIVMQVSYESGGGLLLYILADPSGYVAVENYSEHLTTIQKNTEYISLSGYVLINRLIWGSVTIICFIIGYKKFSFKSFITARPIKNKKENFEEVSAATLKHSVIKDPVLSYNILAYTKKLFTLSKLEFLNIVRPSSFKFILGIMMLMVLLQNILFNASYYIGKEVALSSNMTFFRLPWGVFIIMLLMIWSAELFFKDKIIKIWQITDSLPVPVWVTQLSKLFAAFSLAFVLCACFMIIGLFSQIIMGGSGNIEWSRYIEDIFGFRWGFLNFVMYISLVFFVAGLTGNRFLTHLLCVGYFFIIIITLELGLLEQRRFLFGTIPGTADYSELSGYGISQVSANWLASMWMVLAVVLVLLGILFWQRGVGKPWYRKIRENQLSFPAKIIAVAGIGLFVFLQGYLHQQIIAKNNFTSSVDEEAKNALYERNYNYLELKPQPKYKRVELQVDFYPKERKTSYTADITLSNIFTDTLFLNFKDFVEIKALQLGNNPLSFSKQDPQQNIITCVIPQNLQKDSVLKLRLKAEKQYTGFTQDDLQPDITFNGSFGPIKEWLPTIGYDSKRELLKNRIRQDNGLAKLTSRMADVNDSIALKQDACSPDAEWVTGSIIISTDVGQLPIAPGKLIKQWVANNKICHQYRIAQAAPLNWCIGSAVYKNFIQGKVADVAYDIIANEKHPYNIKLYDDVIKKSIIYFKANIPAFSLDELRLIEINHWNEPFYVFPNAIAISEKEGWVADTSGINEKAYIYQTIGSQIAKLWIQQNIPVANVQGADMFRIAIPEAMGLLFVANSLGKEYVDAMIRKKNDKYGKDRNNEPNTEPSLLYADGIAYLEANKGAVAIYNLINEINKDYFFKTLNTLQRSKSPAVFEHFYGSISNNLSPKLKLKFEKSN